MIDARRGTVLALALCAAGCTEEEKAPAIDAAIDVAAITDARDVPVSETAPRDVTTTTADAGALDAGDIDAGCPSLRLPNLTCVGSVRWRTPTATTAMPRFSRGPLRPPEGGGGAHGRACAYDDRECASPYSEGDTDDDAGVALTYPLGDAGFSGYYEVTGAGLTPTLIFAVPPEWDERANPIYRVVSQADFDLLSTVARITRDPMKGYLAAELQGCDQHGAAGLAVGVVPVAEGATRFHFQRMLPNTAATETDITGIGGWFNLPPGEYTVTSSIAACELRIASAPVFTRAGWLSSLGLQPTP